MSTATAYSAETWNALRDQIAAWAVERVKADGRVFLADTANHFRISPRTARRALDQLAASGCLVRFGRRSGYGAIGVAVVGADLQSLLDFARTRVRADVIPPKGRRDVTADRRLEWITESQFEAARAAAALAAWGVTGDKHRLAAVGPEHLRWSEAAGEFEIVGRLSAWSDQRAQERHRGPGVWHRGLNAAAREKHLAGMRTLLDVAATAGRVARGAAHSIEYRQHAAEWQPWVEHAVAALTPAGTGPAAAKDRLDGARVLARYCTRFGWAPSSQVDWGRVQDALRTDRQAEIAPLSERDYKTARLVYRRLQRAGHIEAPAWGKPHGGRLNLASEGAIAYAVESRDFSAWDAPGLTDGTRGLSGYVTWLDARLEAHELRALGLPKRELLHATVQQRVRAERRLLRGRALFARSLPVLKQTARMIGYLAGWAQRAGLYDPATQSLERLARPETAQAFIASHAAADGIARRCHFGRIARELSTIASPFLESQATDRNEAMRLAQAAADLTVLAAKHAPTPSEVHGAEKKMRVWAGTTETAAEAYQKLEALVGLLVGEMERAYGKSLAEIEADVGNGEPRPRNPIRFAIAARDAVLINVQRLVALRPANVVGLDVGTHFKASGERPWEGALWIEVPADEFKGHRLHDPSLIRPAEVGEPAAERNVRRDLLRIYLAPGCARDLLLTDPDGSKIGSRRLFPPAPRREGSRSGGTPGCLTPRGYSDTVRRAVLRHARALGLNPRQLKATRGASTGHVLRHILASLGVETGRAATVARLLGHADVSTTERRYAFSSPRSASAHQVLAGAASASRTDGADAGGVEMKLCPDCAEEVRAAARKCRFCQYRFDEAR